VHVAATHGREEVLAALLDWAPGAASHADDMGATPLRLAAEQAHPRLLLLLVARGADVRHARGARGAPPDAHADAHFLPRQRMSPLTLAAAAADVATCATLLSLGARGTGRGPVTAAAAVAARRARMAVALPPAAAADAALRAAHAARAARAAAAAAATAMLRTAAAGVPLLWSFAGHRAFPEPFRAAVADVLRALHASLLRVLPLPLRDRILQDVLEAAAATQVWPALDAAAWRLVREGDAVRRARALPPAERPGRARQQPGAARGSRGAAHAAPLLAGAAPPEGEAAPLLAANLHGGAGDSSGSDSSDSSDDDGDGDGDGAHADLLLPGLLGSDEETDDSDGDGDGDGDGDHELLFDAGGDAHAGLAAMEVLPLPQVADVLGDLLPGPPHLMAEE
jgi:hypothetical protein